MIMIKLIDARRGLYLKCGELFGDKKIAENIYKYLCEGIEECEECELERKTGEWIEVDDAYNRIRGRCSLCGWEAHMYEDDVVGMNYCPNCGADMRG